MVDNYFNVLDVSILLALIHRLHTYNENGYFKLTTQFCTFDITDLYTILPQEQSVDVISEFLL